MSGPQRESCRRLFVADKLAPNPNWRAWDRCVNASGWPLSLIIGLVDNVTLTLPPRTLTPDPGYEFTVFVTKDMRNSSASAVIRITPGAPPGVSVGGLTADAYVNQNEADDGTTFYVACVTMTSCITCTALSRSAGAYLALVGTTHSSAGIASTQWTKVAGAGEADDSVFAIEPTRSTTAIALWRMTPGVEYTFRLTVIDVLGEAVYAEVEVTINIPPSSGSCAVTPTRGCARRRSWLLLLRPPSLT